MSLRRVGLDCFRQYREALEAARARYKAALEAAKAEYETAKKAAMKAFMECARARGRTEREAAVALKVEELQHPLMVEPELKL